MAKREKVYTPAKKLSYAETSKAVQQLIYENASKGLSKRTIASKVGMTLEEFHLVLDLKEGKTPVYQMSYDAGRAEFEDFNATVIDEILNSDETSEGIKAKLARDNLKIIEEWAPATRAVKVQIEDKRTTFDFVSLTPEEEAAISVQVNAAEDDSSSN